MDSWSYRTQEEIMLGCDQVIWCLRSRSFCISFLDTQYQKNHSACLSPPYTDNHTCTCTWGAEEEGGNGDRQLVIQGPDKYVGWDKIFLWNISYQFMSEVRGTATLSRHEWGLQKPEGADCEMNGYLGGDKILRTIGSRGFCKQYPLLSIY